jgi:hypothetical protein
MKVTAIARCDRSAQCRSASQHVCVWHSSVSQPVILNCQHVVAEKAHGSDQSKWDMFVGVKGGHEFTPPCDDG